MHILQLPVNKVAVKMFCFALSGVLHRPHSNSMNSLKFFSIDVPSSAAFPFVCSLTRIGRRSLLIQQMLLSTGIVTDFFLFSLYYTLWSGSG